jgi:hypothetical protein
MHAVRKCENDSQSEIRPMYQYTRSARANESDCFQWRSGGRSRCSKTLESQKNGCVYSGEQLRVGVPPPFENSRSATAGLLKARYF